MRCPPVGTIWCCIGSFSPSPLALLALRERRILIFALFTVNQFFHIRVPALSLSVNEVQLLSFPFGKALEKLLPTKVFTTFGYHWSFNVRSSFLLDCSFV